MQNEPNKISCSSHLQIPSLQTTSILDVLPSFAFQALSFSKEVNPDAWIQLQLFFGQSQGGNKTLLDHCSFNLLCATGEQCTHRCSVSSDIQELSSYFKSWTAQEKCASPTGKKIGL